MTHLAISIIRELSTEFEEHSPRTILQWAANAFGSRIAISTAFGPEGLVIIDVSQTEVAPRIPIFTIDTGFLFPETEALIAKVERRYGITVERLYPQLPPEEVAAASQPELYLHRRDPDRCCYIRKVLPLRAKLLSLDALVTGVRRTQSESRRKAAILELQETPDGHRYVKINPLATWTHHDVWHYIRSNGLDYNALHDRGYASIGCSPEQCTRPIRPGEDERAGRWAGKEKTECGLHTFARPVAIRPTQTPPAAGADFRGDTI